ncbi:MAG: sulfatase-like hydrolase/transferase [Caldilineaceae bacterium]
MIRLRDAIRRITKGKAHPTQRNERLIMPTTAPNIIFILADDMGYGDVSCLNEAGKIHTTHIDQLAAAGMIYRDAHATSAVCTPSRYSILTKVGRNWRSARNRASPGATRRRSWKRGV